ncbi:NAD(P)H dehydrogenase (quinone) [Parageobacillus genomosp. 1]|uniref:FMN dependent NADH:quinone oxidoreductase n=1 Tax=Parageobacillus genomosp. 1 TaxID=1295642 RepID=A0ABC9VEA3_9BACL|nr:FMN-dependent NADH-azoreductase [Parageobacillus genomosp. 1]EZP76790.1 NAD(P)H dehydrogenase (quinone) [Parageobacillus genomosp. 1]
MAKLLYITANPKREEESYSLSVGRAFLDAYKQQNPQDEIIELDLYRTDIPYIDADVLNGWGKLQQGYAFEQLNTEEKQKISRINELTDQFISADKYVFVTPMWNFSFPPKMKAFIDTICIAGKTFRYTENGPVGLLTGRKALHIQARGGIYSEEPMKEMEFGDRYLRAIFSFIGITDVQSIIVEGMAQFPNEAEAIKQNAIKQAEQAAKNF